MYVVTYYCTRMKFFSYAIEIFYVFFLSSLEFSISLNSFDDKNQRRILLVKLLQIMVLHVVVALFYSFVALYLKESILAVSFTNVYF